MFRTLRNVFYALYLMLTGRGLQAPEYRYPALHTWVENGRALILQIFQVAETAGLSEAERRKLTMHLEGREISVETILAAARHNFSMEYPMLMDARIEHNLTTLYALNMNDQFRVMRLAESGLLEAYPAVLQAVKQLSQHLSEIPPSNTQE